MPIARFSQRFLPTLKEAPADAVVPSHRLLLRAGFVRQLGAGIYDQLPLGRRTVARIEQIVREEMDGIGAQEFHLPALHPAEIWKESGRWDVMGDNLFRLVDRKGGDYCLGMTHEEVFTAIARDELRSYRQLPQVWYQIQPKFRDEARPKSGLLRVRQFTMKDAYSFDIDEQGLDRSFEDQRLAYERIFTRCGIAFVAVEAHSGAMGGSVSQEFMVRTDAGEDHVAACASCRYAANLETARSRGSLTPHAPGLAYDAPRRFPTPGARTIAALAAPPFSRAAETQLKTLVFVGDGVPVIAVVRGDDDLNEAKLQSACGAAVLRPARPDEIRPLMGADPGSLGAVGFTGCRVFVDRSLERAAGMVTGANVDDYHLEGVDVARDLGATPADLRSVRSGEGCPVCDGVLDLFKAVEVGHIFKLGTRYSVSMNATVLDADGVQVPLVMGSYGIGIERIMATAVELHHDEDGIVWPMSIAPYHAIVLTLGREPELAAAADAVVASLDRAGVDVLYDDRDERPGVKFKDADLLGIPIRVAIGRKGLADGVAEWKLRAEPDMELVPYAEVAERAARLVRG
jgi:prolyl-tRNA synthetase